MIYYYLYIKVIHIILFINERGVSMEAVVPWTWFVQPFQGNTSDHTKTKSSKASPQLKVSVLSNPSNSTKPISLTYKFPQCLNIDLTIRLLIISWLANFTSNHQHWAHLKEGLPRHLFSCVLLHCLCVLLIHTNGAVAGGLPVMIFSMKILS